jgi:large subunit ribosomal protein L15
VKIHELKPPAGAHHDRRRVGRGLGSGRGKTSGKGVKGQKARAGGGVPPYFEGGQLPLVRKLPYRRGFTNPFRVEYHVVNLDQLETLTEETVTPETLLAAGLIGKGRAPVKVLARGTLTKRLTIHAHAFSGAAREAITGVGGSVVTIGAPEEIPQPAAEEPPPAPAAEERPATRRRRPPTNNEGDAEPAATAAPTAEAEASEQAENTEEPK